MRSREYFSLCILLACVLNVHAQTASLTVNKKRLVIASSVVGAAYVGTMVTLSQAWYKNDARESFHFFNDAAEWKQMDKVGHFYSSFYLASHGSAILRRLTIISRARPSRHSH